MAKVFDEFRHTMLTATQRYRSLLACFAFFCALTISNTASAVKCHFGTEYKGPSKLQALNSNEIRASEIDLSKAVSPELAKALSNTLEETLKLTAATEASVSFYSSKHGYWSQQYSQNSDAEAKRLFWLASISKLATATIIGQLIEEKQLLPEDTIERWFPSVPNAELITIESLLTHTSGLRNFNQIESVIKDQNYQTPLALLAAASKHEPDFCPLTDWYYSNTGYLVLALIAEQLDEQPLSNIIEQRIGKPLGLSNFKVVGPNDPLESVVQPVPNADSKVDAKSSDKNFISEIASIHGAGSLAASTDDALILLAAYLRGELISDSSVNDSFKTLYPLFSEAIGYGRGIMVTRVPDPEQPTTWVGHSGGSPRGAALVTFDLKREAYMSIALNTQAPVEAIANALFKVLDHPLQTTLGDKNAKGSNQQHSESQTSKSES